MVYANVKIANSTVTLYLGVHTKYLIFLANIMTDFNKNPQYQISRKSVRLEPR
jgi:hypothetical protein